MSDRQRRRRLEKKLLATKPPRAAVLRRLVPPPSKPYSQMTTAEIAEDCRRRILNITEMQVANLQRSVGLAGGKPRLPKTFVGGPLQPAPSRVIVAAKPKGGAGRTVRRASRSCP